MNRYAGSITPTAVPASSLRHPLVAHLLAVGEMVRDKGIEPLLLGLEGPRIPRYHALADGCELESHHAMRDSSVSNRLYHPG